MQELLKGLQLFSNHVNVKGRSRDRVCIMEDMAVAGAGYREIR